jgi:hypothetical protein
MAIFNASFRQTGSFKASLADEIDRFSSTFRTVVAVSDYEIYEGPYAVRSSLSSDVTLPTEGKLMGGDMTVQKVRVVKTSNLCGGQTVIIG